MCARDCSRSPEILQIPNQSPHRRLLPLASLRQRARCSFLRGRLPQNALRGQLRFRPRWSPRPSQPCGQHLRNAHRGQPRNRPQSPRRSRRWRALRGRRRSQPRSPPWSQQRRRCQGCHCAQRRRPWHGIDGPPPSQHRSPREGRRPVVETMAASGHGSPTPRRIQCSHRQRLWQWRIRQSQPRSISRTAQRKMAALGNFRHESAR